MILPTSKDAEYKAWLYRLLIKIYDQPELAASFYFKGGTCAAMLGWLDRFSIDLDFDYVGEQKNLGVIRQALEKVFTDLGLEIKDMSKQAPQYFLRYPALKDARNTIKIDTTFPVPKSNVYKPYHLQDIDRVITCQTIETMFANKLVALIERYEKRESIAGRDLYDIHHFFMQSFRYNVEVILERRGIKKLAVFFQELVEFIEKHITQKIIDQDINALVAPEQFRRIRTHLKRETLMFLQDEIKRIV